MPDLPAIAYRLSRWQAGRLTVGLHCIFMFYTYVLKSLKDNDLYIGYSNNLKQRLQQHNSGFVDATKYRIPLELVYYEACVNQEKAIQREKYFKTGFERNFLKNRI